MTCVYGSAPVTQISCLFSSPLYVSLSLAALTFGSGTYSKESTVIESCMEMRARVLLVEVCVLDVADAAFIDVTFFTKAGLNAAGVHVLGVHVLPPTTNAKNK